MKSDIRELSEDGRKELIRELAIRPEPEAQTTPKEATDEDVTAVLAKTTKETSEEAGFFKTVIILIILQTARKVITVATLWYRERVKQSSLPKWAISLLDDL